jgi:fructose-specific phosphotransferase system IIA component
MTIDELLAHMGPALFVPSLDAKTKPEVLEQLTDAAIAGSEINDRELVLGLLQSREQLGSTALERGVAFPHGRSLAVQKLTIVAARSEKGIDFESEDGKPTHLFFLILAPPHDTGNLYLQALGKIAGLLKDEGVRDQLMSCDDYDSFIEILKG